MELVELMELMALMALMALIGLIGLMGLMELMRLMGLIGLVELMGLMGLMGLIGLIELMGLMGLIYEWGSLCHNGVQRLWGGLLGWSLKSGVIKPLCLWFNRQPSRICRMRFRVTERFRVTGRIEICDASKLLLPFTSDSG